MNIESKNGEASETRTSTLGGLGKKNRSSGHGSLHDALFRTLFDAPQRAMETLRPALPNSPAGFPDWNVMPKLVESAFVDEALRNGQADMPLEVKLTNGRPALVHMPVERKSHPDPGTPLQMAGHMVQIGKRFAEGKRERLKALPPTCPFLVRNGKIAWDCPLCLSQLVVQHENAPPPPRFAFRGGMSFSATLPASRRRNWRKAFRRGRPCRLWVGARWRVRGRSWRRWLRICLYRSRSLHIFFKRMPMRNRRG